jgi:exodeoxyribonuclease VII large subunit
VPRVAELRDATAALAVRLRRAQALLLAGHALRLEGLASHLSHLDPRQVLARGYAIVSRKEGGVVYAAAQLASGDEVEILLGQGSADARVIGVKP